MTMSFSELICVEIYRDGKEYGRRHWRAVPRVGEEIALKDPARSTRPDELFAHRITRIIWGVNLDDEEKRFGTGAVTVRLFVEAQAD